MIPLEKTSVAMNKAMSSSVEEIETYFLYFNHGNLNSISTTKFSVWNALTETRHLPIHWKDHIILLSRVGQCGSQLLPLLCGHVACSADRAKLKTPRSQLRLVRSLVRVHSFIQSGE